MSFKVKLFRGMPDFETLHAAKLALFPLEKRDYKPYSQARVCFSDDGMNIQMLAFEAQPLPDSMVKAVFRLWPETPPLVLSLAADGSFGVNLGEKDLASQASVHTFEGEDLQGVYWGGNILVTQELLGRHFPDLYIEGGTVFTGNFYKICEDPARVHHGSYYPADFSKPLTDPCNLGGFIVINY